MNHFYTLFRVCKPQKDTVIVFQNQEKKQPLITSRMGRFISLSILAILMSGNVFAQWASINYTVWPTYLAANQNCSGNGSSSYWQGNVKYTDNANVNSSTHTTPCANYGNTANIMDNYTFPSTTSKADAVTCYLFDVRDDACSNTPCCPAADNCSTMGNIGGTKYLRADNLPSLSFPASNNFNWGASYGAGGRHNGAAKIKWNYVVAAGDPVIHLSTCPTEYSETYASNTSARIPSWAVYLEQGATYNFSTCGTGFDNYMRLFDMNGADIYSQNVEGNNFTCNLTTTIDSSGVYFLELSKWASLGSWRGAFTEGFQIRMTAVDNQAPTGINAANPLKYETLYTCASSDIPSINTIPTPLNFRDNCSSEPAQISIYPAYYLYSVQDWESTIDDSWSFSSEIDIFDFSFNSPWFVTTDLTSTGLYSIKCAGVPDGAYSRFTTTTNEISTITVSFELFSSTEYDYDWLYFMVDGAVLGQWSGLNYWTQALFEIPAGPHTLEWRYQKNDFGSDGDDAVWVDNIIIPRPLSESVNYSFPETHLRSYSVFDDAGNSTVVEQIIYAGNVEQLLAGGIVYNQGVLSTAALVNYQASGQDMSLLSMYNFEWIDCEFNSTVLSTSPFFTIPQEIQDHQFALRCDFMGACSQYTPCFYYDVTPPTGYISDYYACNANEVPSASDVQVTDLTDNIPNMPIQVTFDSETQGTSQIPLILVRNYTLTDMAQNSNPIMQIITVANMDLLLESIAFTNGTLSLTSLPEAFAADNYAYQWVDCNNNNAPIAGANSTSFTPLVSGSYALLCEYSPLGAGTEVVCSAISSCTDVTIASVENTATSGFTMFPNPNKSDKLYFTYSGAIDHVDIFNVLGELVLSSHNMSNKSMNIASLAPGNYFVKLHSDLGCLTNNLIVTE
jgi:hypothetical protein